MAWGNYTAAVQALPHTRESSLEEESGGGIRDEAGSSTCSPSLMIHSLVTITITIVRELMMMMTGVPLHLGERLVFQADGGAGLGSSSGAHRAPYPLLSGGTSFRGLQLQLGPVNNWRLD